MKDLSSSHRRDKQNSRIHENSKHPSTNKMINQPLIQESRQSVIFDECEEVLLNVDRRVLIDDGFYQEKSSVLRRLGPKANLNVKLWGNKLNMFSNRVAIKESNPIFQAQVSGPTIAKSQKPIQRNRQSTHQSILQSKVLAI